jgi:hypothetical protein
MKLTIHEEYRHIDITIDLQSNQRTVYPGACPNSLFLVCKPWDIDNLNIYLKIAIDTEGRLTYVWTTESSEANHYLHLDCTYFKENNKVEKTDAMMETIEGLFSGRIKIDNYKVAVGGTAQVKPLNLEREEEKIGKQIFLA